jgi:periplasmic protein CpxP/Spy
MISNRNWLAGSLLAGAALITAGAGASLADDAPSSATAAQGRQGWHHHGAGHLLSKLNLSADQQAQIKTIMTSAGPQMKSIHQQMHANSLRLSQTQPTDSNYSNVVAEVSQANATLHAQMTTHRAEVRASVFKVLTPAQQTQLAALEAQLQSRPHGGFGPRGAGAPPAAP